MGKLQMFFTYVISLSWLLMISTICYVAIAEKENAVDVIMALCETSPLWGGILGVFGVSLFRTKTSKNNLNNKSGASEK